MRTLTRSRVSGQRGGMGVWGEGRGRRRGGEGGGHWGRITENCLPKVVVATDTTSVCTL